MNSRHFFLAFPGPNHVLESQFSGIQTIQGVAHPFKETAGHEAALPEVQQVIQHECACLGLISLSASRAALKKLKYPFARQVQISGLVQVLGHAKQISLMLVKSQEQT